MITAVVTLFFALVVLLIAAYHITKYVTKEDPAFEDPTPTYTKEELDNIKLAEELYNKDLRPIVAKKAKAKPAPELNVVEPEFVAKVVETAKVFPPDAAINLEALVETPKPVKKKRKYHRKNKK